MEGSEREMQTSAYWTARSQRRKDSVNRYLWDSGNGMFRDYNTASRSQTPFESVTSFYALWSGLADESQARQMLEKTLPKFENSGGLSSTTEPSAALDPDGSEGTRGRQWDYPFGWAPHQVIVWDGLSRYGFRGVAQRLAYRWLYNITKVAWQNNGMVTERYNVVHIGDTGASDVEYGNQGRDFEGVPKEG